MSEDTLMSFGNSESIGMSAGQMIRQAREASGLHVAALAVAMKVPVKKLEALEADRFSELPDAVFVRALAASVCRTLKLDPGPVLSKLPQTSAVKFESESRGVDMNRPYSGSGVQYGKWFFDLLRKPATFVVIALVLAAAAILFLPESTPELPSAPVRDSVAEPVSTQVVPVSPPSLQASVPADTAVAPLPVSAASTPATVDAVIAFKATDSTWVRVTDSKGAIQFEKMLTAGETATAGGTLPLSVVVGNVGATSVEVHGQPFALDPFNKGNVARFEVN